MPKYTLNYFNLKGRAETARLLFALAEADYEDNRIDFETFFKIKPTLPLAQLPVLDVDGKRIFQSEAINRYLASEFGFYGSSAIERAEVDSIIETLDELTPYIVVFVAEKDEANKAKLKEEFEKEHMPKNLANLEKLLRTNKGGDGWFVGDKVSLADIESFSKFNDFYSAFVGGPVDLSKYEKFSALMKRVEALPKIAEWLKKRPVTSR